MNPDASERFDVTFRALTGHSPLPWQVSLFSDWFAQGKIPPSCDLPTGLGKTSVMAIWLIALAHSQGGLPRRLVYVVNRRTVVDQATREAEILRHNLKSAGLLEPLARLCGLTRGEPLAISTLRGQFADNGEWCADPARPAIIVGTVDMIGSRLLFNGYRAGSWQLARHAGLIGQDAIVVHDEAHLEPAFQSMVEWVGGRQRSDGSPRPLQIMAMSATGRAGGGEKPFTLSGADASHPVVIERMNAVKRLHLHSHEPKANRLADRLIDLAWAHADTKARVIVYARRPEDAGRVFNGLLERIKKTANEGKDRVALLTGRIRGYERERLLAHPAVNGLLHANDDAGRRIVPEQTTWLVATSAGEVGADFDADHLVGDLSPIDSMIQRCGRVNRRGGEGRAARIDVVLDLPEKPKPNTSSSKQLTPFDLARTAAATLLTGLPTCAENAPSPSGPGIIRDASPAALRELVRQHPDAYSAATSPKPGVITPHDVVLDAWALTSIQEDWPLAHDVHPYLHGLDDPEPETYVAWRAELDQLPPAEADVARQPATVRAVGEIMRTALRHCPLNPLELLRETPGRVAELLVRLAESEPASHTWIVRIRQRSILPPQRLQDLVGANPDVRQLARLLRYETVILTASVGGLDVAGMLAITDPKSASGLPACRDVGDLAPIVEGEPDKPTRRRVLLAREDDGQWRVRILNAQEAKDDTSDGASQDAQPRWGNARDQVERAHGMKCVGRVVLAEEDDGPSRMLLFLRAKDVTSRFGRQGSTQRVPIADHNPTVQRIVDRMAQSLGVDPAVRRALEAASGGHDLGKADSRWQAMIRNEDLNTPLAKSFGEGFDTNKLNGYRHEFGSLRALVEQWPPDDPHTLALHLVASHHGRGRPHFESRAMADPSGLQDELPPQLQPAATACRFASLQRTFGHWGLAWLESILMAADAEGSDLVAMPADELAEEQA